MGLKRPLTSESQSPRACDHFTELVPPLVPVLLRVAAALVGRDNAEDAVQEAIVSAWQHWSELRDTAAVRSWLIQITANVCRQWQRGRFGTRQRRTVSLTTDDLLAEPLLGADLNTPEYAAEMDLRQALGQLPEQLRLIVALRYFVDMDATEIGLVLQLPSATVRTRLRRALARLRSGLKQKEGRPPVTIEEEGS